MLDRFDFENKIKYRLYREHTQIIDGVNIKDLNKLGRDITKTLIIDNVEANFKLTPDNGYHIKNFEGEEEDEELIFLKKELLKLAESNVDDVRTFIPKLRNNMKDYNRNIVS